MSVARLLPWPLHGGVEYLAGIFLVLAPFLFGFRDGDAFPVFMGVGVVILVIALLSPAPTGVFDLLPANAHAVLDYILAVFLLVAPFIFGFGDTPELISILLGLAHLVISLLTRYPHVQETETTRPWRRSSAP